MHKCGGTPRRAHVERTTAPFPLYFRTPEAAADRTRFGDARMKRRRSHTELPCSDAWGSSLPSDASVALTQLRATCGSFDSLSAVPAFPLSSLRGVLGRVASLELTAEVRALSTARVVTLGSDAALVLLADLDDYIRRERERAAAADPRACAALSFYAVLVRGVESPAVSLADAERHYSAWVRSHRLDSAERSPHRKLAAVGAASSAARAAAAAASSAKNTLPQLLQELISRGLLLRGAVGGGVSYAFGVPSSGRLVVALADGRAELVTRVRRAGAAGLLRNELLRVPLKKTALSLRLLILDALGSRALVSVSSPAGAVLRVP